MVTNWLLDFDDTLASGSTTWGWKHALPKLVREHQLPFDRERFQRAAQAAQARVADSAELEPAIEQLFQTMGWPAALQKALIEDVLTSYEPELFADAVPFLDRLRAARHTVYIVSNNPRSVALAQRLGIAPYIARFFTPDAHADGLAKPDPRLWAHIAAAAGVTAQNSAVVGDDPWTDGAFAEQCGLACWLVDRDERFGALDEGSGRRRVASLAEIPVDG